MKMSLFEIIEQEEMLNKLRARGHGKLVDALLGNENDVYTKKGRLNKSGACRVLQWKTKALEDALAACKEILMEELSPD